MDKNTPYYISSEYYPRDYQGSKDFHNGIDMSPKVKNFIEKQSGSGLIAVGDVPKVYSAAAGIVKARGFDDINGGGWWVKIDLFEQIDGKPVQLIYMHLNVGLQDDGSSICVENGQIVKAGDPIADMGGTGIKVKIGNDGEMQSTTRSSGVHLHFEVRTFVSKEDYNRNKYTTVNPRLHFNLRVYNK